MYPRIAMMQTAVPQDEPPSLMHMYHTRSCRLPLHSQGIQGLTLEGPFSFNACRPAPAKRTPSLPPNPHCGAPATGLSDVLACTVLAQKDQQSMQK